MTTQLDMTASSAAGGAVDMTLLIPPPKNKHHSWSVANFETFRAPLTEFMKTKVLPHMDTPECRRILIRAPVKSGKREMVEYLAKRDEAHNPVRVHAFVSAFHRVADESQRDELKSHNLEVFSLNLMKHADACLAWITHKIAEGKQVILHLDECDFGSGSRQLLTHVYRNVRTNPSVTILLYSATPEEVLFSGDVGDVEESTEFQEMVDEIMDIGVKIEYTPPPTFCGPARFLDADLIQEATPFFRRSETGLTLSRQGAAIMADLRAALAAGSKRNIVVLRLSYSDSVKGKAKKENKAIYQFLRGVNTIPELEDCLIIADKGEKDIPKDLDGRVVPHKIGWSDPNFWKLLTAERPLLVVLDQTSSRSTEWACHDRVFAMHDYRNSVTYSVLSQAQERVNHYEGRYGGFQPIRVYGHTKTFQLSAHRIGYAEYLRHDWEAKKVERSMAVRLSLGDRVWQIRSSTGSHPDYPAPMTEAEAKEVLQEIGCAGDIKMSPRVKGTFTTVPVIASEFFPCSKDTWSSVHTTLSDRYPGRGHKITNPFPASERNGLRDGRWTGYLRGWKVFDYERDIESKGWGLSDGMRRTICYRGEELGIAVSTATGATKKVNTMEVYRSMYGE